MISGHTWGHWEHASSTSYESSYQAEWYGPGGATQRPLFDQQQFKQQQWAEQQQQQQDWYSYTPTNGFYSEQWAPSQQSGQLANLTTPPWRDPQLYGQSEYLGQLQPY